MDASFNELSKKIFDNPNISEAEKNDFMRELAKLKTQKINLLITGATGCGKSSTINAMFGMEKAKVGTGVDPETMEIERYDLDNLVIWDSPGLGDGMASDTAHKKKIIDLLARRVPGDQSKLFLDMVLVVVEGSKRDLGTTVALMNDVILPFIEAERVLVIINQADVAMKEHGLDKAKNAPSAELAEFLATQAKSIMERISKDTGAKIPLSAYCAEKRYVHKSVNESEVKAPGDVLKNADSGAKTYKALKGKISELCEQIAKITDELSKVIGDDNFKDYRSFSAGVWLQAFCIQEENSCLHYLLDETLETINKLPEQMRTLPNFAEQIAKIKELHAKLSIIDADAKALMKGEAINSADFQKEDFSLKLQMKQAKNNSNLNLNEVVKELSKLIQI